MAKQKTQAAAPVKPAQPAQAETEPAVSTDAAIDKILDDAEPAAVEEETSHEGAEEGAETEGDDAGEQTPIEGAELAEAGATDEAATEEAEGTEQDEDPELEPLREYADDKGEVDLKRLSKDIRTMKAAQSQGKLTPDQEADLRDIQRLRAMLQKDPELVRSLQAADARARGVQAPAVRGRLSWEEAKTQARKLREEGKHEEAYELLRDNDPKIVALEQKVTDVHGQTAADLEARRQERVVREFGAVEQKYGQVSEPVFNEMKRLCAEEGMGSRPVETVYKLASINLGVSIPTPKQAANGNGKKAPIKVNLRGRGVAKGGGEITRQPPAAKSNVPEEVAATAKEIEGNGVLRKIFRG